MEIHPGVEGLVHISELASHHVENPREVVSQGDTLSVRIIEIDPERRRLSLSLKRVADVEGAEGHHRADDEPDYGAPPDADAAGGSEFDAIAQAEPVASDEGTPEAIDVVELDVVDADAPQGGDVVELEVVEEVAPQGVDVVELEVVEEVAADEPEA